MIKQPNPIQAHHSHSMQLYKQPQPSPAQYSYALHLKYGKELPIEQEQIKSVINTARNALHKTYNSKKKLRQKKKQREFYFRNTQERRNMLDQYEQFQQNMMAKTIKTRIRVFSNSKTQSQKATPNSKHKHVPVKVINLKEQIKNTNKPASNRKITRVPKAQPRKVQATPVKNQRKIAIIRLFETSRQKPTKQKKYKQNTAEKKRTHKLSVTSVRRTKQDSFQSYRRDMSSQILGLKPSNSTEHHQSSILVNSFNMTTTMFP